MKYKIVNLFVFFTISIVGFSQTDYFKLGKEYYNNGDFEKAAATYSEVVKKEENLPKVYDTYLSTLYKLKNYPEAEKIIKKMIKMTAPDNYTYRIDYALFYKQQNLTEKAEKEFSSFISSIQKNSTAIDVSGSYLQKIGEYTWAKQLYLQARKNFDRYAYCFQLSTIYNRLGETDNMLDELLNYLNQHPEEIEPIQNVFQNELETDEQFSAFETKVYDRINKDPSQIIYNQLLLWLNIQRRNFSKAFTQAKAIDKRSHETGTQVMEVGNIALENKDYDAAAMCYQFIADTYKDSYAYTVARRMLIQTREEQIKNTFPVEKSKIVGLINDYNQLIKENGRTAYTLESLRNMALLHAFYLDKKDTAIVILQSLIENPYTENRLRGKAKIDLGDIYLLTGEPWESTLLYSQVEKDFKEDPLGHEAKLRNAKLYYYRGEFLLAQEQLDVLKLATTREISNDAIQMSVFITENSGLDSTTDALRDYSAIELLIFQRKYNEALVASNMLLMAYPHHELTDDVYWLQATILRQTGKPTEALEMLKKISTGYADDLLGDDALFTSAQIYEFDLKDNAKAMQLYQDFLVKYTNSVYVVEARKRYRILRGDKI
ncbi:tetratricopeptide repeat protein [Cytophaga aurantiaca]|uniref:tetratricopeptide repeat protein n=1 Tax=Cytophaga aurantiaca TaxID=29530 RepID=UPI000372E257|nr:tetratricopeptide repeat protein [Cytophaga aurantiaca]